jgi:hypothetical protein
LPSEANPASLNLLHHGEDEGKNQNKRRKRELKTQEPSAKNRLEACFNRQQTVNVENKYSACNAYG